MPDSDLLKGLKEFSSTADAGGGVTSLLCQLGEKTLAGEPAKAGAGAITTGAGLPALSKKLMERIWSGQYVDFTDLPPAKGCTRPVPAIEEGQIVVVRAEDVNGTRKLIPDLATWVQCFSLYMAVITEKDPGRTKSLLAYMTVIAKASTKYKWPSWVVYDQNYRQDAADSGITDWSKVDPSTYTQCFTNAAISSENWCRFCQSIDHASDICPCRVQSSLPRKRVADFPNTGYANPAVRKRPPPRSVPMPCRLYNQYNGECKFGESCIFQHKCDKCGGHGHPRSRCSEQKKSM